MCDEFGVVDGGKYAAAQTQGDQADGECAGGESECGRKQDGGCENRGRYRPNRNLRA
jgi:hypothetical protein